MEKENSLEDLPPHKGFSSFRLTIRHPWENGKLFSQDTSIKHLIVAPSGHILTFFCVFCSPGGKYYLDGNTSYCILQLQRKFGF